MKARRQKKIQELITNEHIRTQEELVSRLIQEGFNVTQATVSRDIKEMGLVKIAGSNDEYRYALQGEMNYAGNHERLKRLWKDVVVSVDSSENIIAVKTIPGNAQALASLIDNSGIKEIIGTVAGDDTIFVLVKPKNKVNAILTKFQQMS